MRSITAGESIMCMEMCECGQVSLTRMLPEGTHDEAEHSPRPEHMIINITKTKESGKGMMRMIASEQAMDMCTVSEA